MRPSRYIIGLPSAHIHLPGTHLHFAYITLLRYYESHVYVLCWQVIDLCAHYCCELLYAATRCCMLAAYRCKHTVRCFVLLHACCCNLPYPAMHCHMPAVYCCMSAMHYFTLADVHCCALLHAADMAAGYLLRIAACCLLGARRCMLAASCLLGARRCILCCRWTRCSMR